MWSNRSVHRERACAVGALAALLLAPWPGPPGGLAAQWRPTPAGAVAPRGAARPIDVALNSALDSALVGPAGVARLTPGGARAVAPRRRHRDPFVAGVLGTAVPGLGHVYAGEPWRGALLLVLAEGAMVTALRAEDGAIQGIGTTVGFAAFVFSILDAPVAATRFNDRHRPPATR